MAARSRHRKASAAARLTYAAKRVVAALVIAVVTYYGFCTLALIGYVFFDPPTTGVQMQRRVASFFDERPYEKRYAPVPLEAISPHLQHAVVAAEDTRFFEHTGVDWKAIQEAVEDNRRRGRAWRGGSTITQQLVKNLFMTTHSSYVRKIMEVPLTYLAEIILTKERILTLYLNVIEWDYGVYGAEAAAKHYYGLSAGGLSRYQSAALAATIPAPLSRTPSGMDGYARTILARMRQMGW